MSQPLDRHCSHPALGEIDRELGEFWFTNPFQMPLSGTNVSAFERNRVFLNLGGAEFLDASFASAADIDADSRSVCVADFDRDGRPDLLVGSVGGGPLRLFLNRMQQEGRVGIELQGVQSNRSGIGTRLIAAVGDRRIVRDVFPANGFLGTSPVWISLGIGRADKIDRLHVRWPSGTEQTIDDIPAGTQLKIVEGQKVVL